MPMVNRFVDKNSHLMTDKLTTYKTIGLQFASHQSVHHGIGEYARGEVHNNTAESFSAIFVRSTSSASIFSAGFLRQKPV
jgi:hypothetical protein